MRRGQGITFIVCSFTQFCVVVSKVFFTQSHRTRIIFKQKYLTETLSSTTTMSQSGLGSNGNKVLLHISQISRTRVTPSDAVFQAPLIWRLLKLSTIYRLNSVPFRRN